MMEHHVIIYSQIVMVKIAHYCVCNFSVSFTLFVNFKMRNKEDKDSKERNIKDKKSKSNMYSQLS